MRVYAVLFLGREWGRDSGSFRERFEVVRAFCSKTKRKKTTTRRKWVPNFTLENVVILNWQMRTTTSQKKKSEGWNKRKHSNGYGDGPSHEENKGDEEEEERISTTHHLEAHSFEIVSPQSGRK